MTEIEKILEKRRAENISHYKELYAMQTDLCTEMVKNHDPKQARDLSDFLIPAQEIQQSIFREIENYLLEPVVGHSLELEEEQVAS